MLNAQQIVEQFGIVFACTCVEQQRFQTSGLLGVFPGPIQIGLCLLLKGTLLSDDNARRFPLGFGDVDVAVVFRGYLRDFGVQSYALAVQSRDVTKRGSSFGSFIPLSRFGFAFT